MKKIMLVLIICVVIITGCSLNNTPNSKVEELLGKYQGLDNSISISSYPITKREDLDDDIENKYRELIKKQYRSLSYEIKDDKIDGDNAVITTEISVLDYKTVIEKYRSKNSDAVKAYDNDLIDDLSKVNKRIVYTIDFNVSKNNKGEWKVSTLTTDMENKLLGIY